jgi:homoserine acetyltransferase
MKENNVIYFTVDDVIEKYKNSYWSRSDENYLLSNVSAVDYSDIATVLNKEYDDVIYKIIKNILYNEYINDIFNKKYSDNEGTSILRKKYKLEYITDTEIEKIFASSALPN